MPRTGGIYSPPAGTKGVSGATIQSVPYNAFVDDLTNDANAARPITAGGTGATTASAARTALGVPTGTSGAVLPFLDASNTWSALQDFLDTSTFRDPSDATKKVRLDAGSVTTGTTRVLNAPDASGTLLLVGDYGLGSAAVTSLSAASALDNVTTTQFNSVASANVATVNGPSGASTGVVLTIRLDASSAAQIYWQSTSSTRVWSRYRTGAGWFSWREIYTAESLLGTVSQSSGVPTGRLIERGTNANGEYVRFADGLQICTFTGASMAISTAVGSVFASAAETWTYPAAFVSGSSPSVSRGSARTSAGTTVPWTAGGTAVPGTTSAEGRLYAGVSGVSGQIHYIAVGRWF